MYVLKTNMVEKDTLWFKFLKLNANIIITLLICALVYLNTCIENKKKNDTTFCNLFGTLCVSYNRNKKLPQVFCSCSFASYTKATTSMSFIARVRDI